MSVGVLSGKTKDGTSLEIVFEAYMKSTPASSSGVVGDTLSALGLNRAAQSLAVVNGLSAQQNAAGSSNDLKVLTFDGYKRSGGGRWATHEIIGQKPVLEFVGAGLEEVSFSMLLHAGLGISPNDELRKLRQMRDEGVVCLLVVGEQQVTENKLVLQKLDEDHRVFDGSGQVLSAAVNVNFVEYIEDPDARKEG